MAKAGNVEIYYTDDRGLSSDGILSSGYLAIIEIGNEPDLHAVDLYQKESVEPFSSLMVLQVRGVNGGDLRTVAAVGLDIEDNEIIPFGNYESAHRIAEMINIRSKKNT